MVRGEVCTYGGGMLRRGCGRPAITDCVYCARPFCEEHGERGEQYMDVCVRKQCQEKLRDLRAHEEWKRRVQVSNDISVCADETCDSRYGFECSRCRLRFCEVHVDERRVRDHRQRPAVEVLALVCAHCHARRRIWD